MSLVRGFLALIIFFELSNQIAFAEEHGGGEHSGGEGGEKSEAAKPEGKFIKKDEWVEIQGKIGSLLARIKLKEESLKKLIEEKNTTKDAMKLGEISKMMVLEHKDLTAAIKEYEQQRSILIYRFPEKGAREERHYQRIEVKSLKDMESKMAIDAQLARTMKKVKKNYPINNEKNRADKVHLSDEKENHSLLHKSDPLSDPVILQK